MHQPWHNIWSIFVVSIKWGHYFTIYGKYYVWSEMHMWRHILTYIITKHYSLRKTMLTGSHDIGKTSKLRITRDSEVFNPRIPSHTVSQFKWEKKTCFFKYIVFPLNLSFFQIKNFFNLINIHFSKKNFLLHLVNKIRSNIKCNKKWLFLKLIFK